MVTRSAASPGAAGPSSGAARSQTVLTVGSGNYTVPAGMTRICIEVIAGGGAGGSADGGSSQAGCGSGGGSGGYLRKWLTVVPGASLAYVVGAKGAKGATGNNAGGAGNDSTFSDGATTYTAKAGLGGASVGAAGTSVLLVAGGTPGAVSTNGDVNGAGQPGEPAHRLSGTLARSGAGGNGFFGGGGKALVAAADGNAGSAPGAGGGGGLSTTTTDRQGGDGADGIIIVTEYS